MPVTDVSVQVVRRNGTRLAKDDLLPWAGSTGAAAGLRHCLDWPANITLRLTSAYSEVLEESLGVPPISRWRAVALPTVPTKRGSGVPQPAVPIPTRNRTSRPRRNRRRRAPTPPKPTPPKPPTTRPVQGVPFGQCADGLTHNPPRIHAARRLHLQAQSSYYSQCCPSNRPCTPGAALRGALLAQMLSRRVIVQSRVP